MVNPIGEILPLATGVAISPLPIIAVILMLFSKRARSNGLAFLIGWVLGLVVIGGLVLSIAGTQNLAPNSEPSIAASIIRIFLGVLLLFLATKQWRNRPKLGEQPTMPKWMRAIDSFGPGKAAGLAFFFSAVSPKNLSLVLTAALDIAQADLGSFQSVMVLCVFMLIGSVSVAGPVVAYLVMGNKAAKTLDGWKLWLIENNATLMFVLFLALGMVLVGKGTTGLSG